MNNIYFFEDLPSNPDSSISDNRERNFPKKSDVSSKIYNTNQPIETDQSIVRNIDNVHSDYADSEFSSNKKIKYLFH